MRLPAVRDDAFGQLARSPRMGMMRVGDQADLPGGQFLFQRDAKDLAPADGIVRKALRYEPKAEIVPHHGNEQISAVGLAVGR